MLRTIIVTVVKSTVGAGYDLIVEGSERLNNEVAYQYDAVKNYFNNLSDGQKKQAEQEKRVQAREALRAKIKAYRNKQNHSSFWTSNEKKEDPAFKKTLSIIQKELDENQNEVKKIRNSWLMYLHGDEIKTREKLIASLSVLLTAENSEDFNYLVKQEENRLGETEAANRLNGILHNIKIDKLIAQIRSRP